MGNFLGTYDFKLDGKGRVNIPSRFRDALSPDAGGTLVIVRGPGGCLRACPPDVWSRYADSLRRKKSATGPSPIARAWA